MRRRQAIRNRPGFPTGARHSQQAQRPIQQERYADRPEDNEQTDDEYATSIICSYTSTFERVTIRRPSQQSALSDEASLRREQDWEDLPDSPSAQESSRPIVSRQNSQRLGTWEWHAIVPSRTCAGSPAAYGSASYEVW